MSFLMTKEESGKVAMENKFPMEQQLKAWLNQMLVTYFKKYSDEFKKEYSENNYTRNVCGTVYKKLPRLAYHYLSDYTYFYMNRRHPHFIRLIQEERERVNIPDSLQSEDLWLSDIFCVNVLNRIFMGLISQEGINNTGPAGAVFADLFSTSPPLEDYIKTLLKESTSVSLAKEIRTFATGDGGGELFMLSVDIIDKLVEQKIRYYNYKFNEMHEGVEEQDGFLTTIDSYDLWYTDAGFKFIIPQLTKDTDTEVQLELEQLFESSLSGEMPVRNSVVDRYAEYYNEYQSFILKYHNVYNLNNLVDGYIKTELREISFLTYPGTNIPELAPSQRTPEGKIRVNFLSGSGVYTLKEVALGYPARKGTWVYYGEDRILDRPGKAPLLHSAEFDRRMIRMPDLMVNKLSAVIDDFATQKSMPVFFEQSLKTVLTEYMSSEDGQLNAARFFQAYEEFLANKIQPLQVCIRDCNMSGIVAITDGNGGYLVISILKGECRILPSDFDSLNRNKKIHRWLLDHLTIYNALRETIKQCFDYKVVFNKINGQNDFMAKPYPISFKEISEYKDRLKSLLVENRKSDINTMIMDSSERCNRFFYDFSLISINLISMILPGATTILGRVFSFILGTGSAVAISIARFCDTDRPNDRNTFFWHALADVANNLQLGLVLIKALKMRLAHFFSYIRWSKGVSTILKLPPIYTHTPPMLPGYSTSFRLLKPVARGTAANIYQLDDGTLLKDYLHPLIQGGYPYREVARESSGAIKPVLYNNALLEANSNAVAFNRIYGVGTATVILHNTNDVFTKTVSVKMKKIPGSSLSAIRDRANQQELIDVRMQLHKGKLDTVVNKLVESLRMKGVIHQDINTGNILYDSATRQFNLVDFDSSKLKALIDGQIVPFSLRDMTEMRTKLLSDLKDFL